MYTLLFASHIKEKPSDVFFDDLAGVIAQTMPHAKDEPYLEKTHEIPEVRGGWYWRLPAVLHDRGLITEWSDEDVEVLAVGKASPGLRPPAQTAARLWRQGGVEAVRALEASFSAIIVDKRTATVFTATDLIAQHALLHFSDGPSVFISPHVLTLAATGTLEVEYDWTSIASSVALDWSLQSRPLVKGVSACRSWEYLKADARGAEVIGRDQLEATFRDRVQPGDAAGVRRVRSDCVELMLEHAADWSSGSADLFVDLSAGADSRGTFALAVAAKGASGIVATTIGEERSLDRTMGHRIAALAGCREQAGSPSRIQSASLADFHEMCRHRTFLQNGDSDARMALFSSVNLRNEATKVNGNGGEIFRGYYYGKMPSRADLAEGGDPFERLADKLATPLSGRLAWSSDEWMQGVRVRARDAVDGFKSASNDMHDVLDLIYLHERLSRWGNIISLAPWHGDLISPYISPRLIRSAYRLPSPVGAFSRLPATLVKAFLPESYWLPVNGRYYFAFEGPGFADKALRRLARVGLKAAETMRASASNDAERHDHNAVRALALGELLQGELRDMILSQDSLSSTLFGQRNAAAMLAAASGGDNRLALCLGHVVAAETWRRMLEDACRLARA